MKKHMVASIVVALVAAMGTSALADPFIDIMVIGEWMTEGETINYTHDLTNAIPVVDVPAGDVVNSAHLVLGFIDDADIWSEVAYVLLDDGTTWQQEVGTGLYVVPTGAITVDWLNNNDGMLGVSVTVDNSDDWIGNWPYADVRLSTSTLTGDFSPVPVPGAVLLGMLGLSLAGAKLRKRA